MATYEEHCRETLKKLGFRYDEVHRWLDELQETLGPNHRSVRHNIDGVKHCIEQWGYGAGAAACIHIQRDEHSHIKQGALWLPKQEGQ